MTLAGASLEALTPLVARLIIESVGQSGQPSDYGFQYFTVGLDPYLELIDQEYLATFIAQGGSAFKMVVGVYGGGKTHFLYCVRDLAWRRNFAVSYVSLSPNQSPFHQLEAVYRALAHGLVPPLAPDELLSRYDRGLPSFLKAWYAQKLREYHERGLAGPARRVEFLQDLDALQGMENPNFSKAIKAASRALLEGREEDFAEAGQWLTGDGFDRRTHGRFGIFQPLDRTTAFPMIRSLAQWVRQLGYRGLVVLLDEAERVPSLSARQREQHLSNLRELIDECGHTSFQGVMLFYAVPDENFLEGRTQIYEALKQRVDTVFEDFNPTGVKIRLDDLQAEPVDFLCQVGEKLADVYEVAYGPRFATDSRRQTIETTAEYAVAHRWGDIGYKRLFVTRLVRALHFLRTRGTPPTLDDLER
ncbi:MAG: DUF2791 family P-loop domain-containing protein [Chloroflexi bacterium]|nr:DUF2791 family P-loop domain-containing protein [Chloroflexota bacterium]